MEEGKEGDEGSEERMLTRSVISENVFLEGYLEGIRGTNLNPLVLLLFHPLHSHAHLACHGLHEGEVVGFLGIGVMMMMMMMMMFAFISFVIL